MSRPGEDPPVEFRFAGLRFFPARQLVLHEGAPITLGSRASDLLHILVARAGEVVSKDELTAFVWPGVRLHASNLKVTMSALRSLLPHKPADPPYIVTVAGRGYRFAGPVEAIHASARSRQTPLATSTPPRPGSRRWRVNRRRLRRARVAARATGG